MRNCLVLISAAAALAAGGCNIIAWPLYVFAPPAPTRTVQPEFEGLKGKSVAVVVSAGPETQLDYTTAQLELSEAVGAELRRQVKVASIVDPRRVIRYQDENPRWDTAPPERLCKVFNADYVLLISLMEFSTREPGSILLARGRITADVSLYESGWSGGSGGRPVWRGEVIRVIHPPESTLGVPARNDWTIRTETQKIFAEKLTKKFYKHKVPMES